MSKSHHPNSVAVYHQIEKEGLLSTRRLQVLGALIRTGKPSTATEIAALLPPSTTGRAGPQGNVHARLTELAARGVVQAGVSRVCTISHRLVTEYRVTGQLPSSLPARPKPIFSDKVLAELNRMQHEAMSAKHYGHAEALRTVKNLMRKRNREVTGSGKQLSLAGT